tara:strand:- start:195 stop:662 length:468 start_codon:yes stop_codon:yes gene_type:complete
MDLIIELHKRLGESEGEITDEIEMLLRKLDIEAQEKILWMCKQRELAVAVHNRQKEKEAAIKKRKISAANSINFWEKKIDNLMQSSNFDNLSLEHFDIKYSNRDRIDIMDKEIIPDNYKVKKESYSISKTLIKEAIKSGQNVPGAVLSTQTLSIL